MYYAKDISISLRDISWNLAMLCEILRPEEPIKRNEIKGFTNHQKDECDLCSESKTKKQLNYF